MPSHEVCQQAVNDLLNFEKNLGQRDWLAWLNLLNSKQGTTRGQHTVAVAEYG
jgi:hypothetical protein